MGFSFGCGERYLYMTIGDPNADNRLVVLSSLFLSAWNSVKPTPPFSLASHAARQCIDECAAEISRSVARHFD